MVYQRFGSAKNGKLETERCLAGVLVRARPDGVVGVHVRGPVVRLDHFVDEEKRCAGWKWCVTTGTIDGQQKRHNQPTLKWKKAKY